MKLKAIDRLFIYCVTQLVCMVLTSLKSGSDLQEFCICIAQFGQLIVATAWLIAGINKSLKQSSDAAHFCKGGDDE